MRMPRILIVEDHATMRDAMRLVLEETGASVEEAADGQAALDAIRREPPDLVFLDLNIPGLGGPEVLSEIRRDEVTASIPVIVVTAQGEEGRASAMRMGAVGYLTKPFGPRALAQAVEQALGGSGRRGS